MRCDKDCIQDGRSLATSHQLLAAPAGHLRLPVLVDAPLELERVTDLRSSLGKTTKLHRFAVLTIKMNGFSV